MTLIASDKGLNIDGLGTLTSSTIPTPVNS